MIKQITNFDFIKLEAISCLFDLIFTDKNQDITLLHHLKSCLEENQYFMRDLILDIFYYTSNKDLMALDESKFFLLLKTISRKEELREKKSFSYVRLEKVAQHKVKNFRDLYKVIIDITLLENPYGFQLDRSNGLIDCLIINAEVRKGLFIPRD